MLAPIRRHRVYRRARKRLRRRFGRRERFFRTAAARAAFAGVGSDRAVYFVSTADRSIGRSLFVENGVRREHVQLERALRLLDDAGVARRRTIVDAGANVGTLRADVEGHEPYVLAGAPALLERAGPLVLELSPPQLERAGGLERLLGQLAGSSTHVHDLSRPGDEPVPASDLRRLLERLDGSLTDVLVRRAR